MLRRSMLLPSSILVLSLFAGFFVSFLTGCAGAPEPGELEATRDSAVVSATSTERASEEISATVQATEQTTEQKTEQDDPTKASDQNTTVQESQYTSNSGETRSDTASSSAEESAGTSSSTAGTADGSTTSTAGTRPVPTRKISLERIREMVRPYIPERFVLVGDAGYRPLTLYHDLDGNGLEDIFLLLMEFPAGVSERSVGAAASDTNTGSGNRTAGAAEGAVPPVESGEADAIPEYPEEFEIRDACIRETSISDMSRLFSEAYPFYLGLFLRNRDGLVSMYRIPLGKWFVFEGFRGMLLDDDRSMPFAVDISFQTHEGRERQLVSFSRYNSFSFFSMKNSISITTETRDIDEDGILDIVEWRRVFEEGTGYETFLTWFKWDGSKFSQHAGTNIVRNLNGYLQTLGNLLAIGKWEQAVSLAVPRDEPADLEKSLTTEELILRLFPALPKEDTAASPVTSDSETSDSGMSGAEPTADSEPAGSAAEVVPVETPGSSADMTGVGDAEFLEEELLDLLKGSSRVFHMVFFPRVWENPFDTGDSECCDGYTTRFSVRFILRDGRNLLRLCTVRMSSNPFLDPQFFLKIEDR